MVWLGNLPTGLSTDELWAELEREHGGAVVDRAYSQPIRSKPHKRNRDWALVAFRSTENAEAVVAAIGDPGKESGARRARHVQLGKLISLDAFEYKLKVEQGIREANHSKFPPWLKAYLLASVGTIGSKLLVLHHSSARVCVRSTCAACVVSSLALVALLPRGECMIIRIILIM
jgi:hypothetical protein